MEVVAVLVVMMRGGDGTGANRDCCMAEMEVAAVPVVMMRGGDGTVA